MENSYYLMIKGGRRVIEQLTAEQVADYDSRGLRFRRVPNPQMAAPVTSKDIFRTQVWDHA